jgi:protein gp37
MREAGGRMANTAKYAGLTRPTKAGPVWTGEVRLWESEMLRPLSVRQPTTWFVNSMGDLFHENVPDEWIHRVHDVMALTPHHTYQILTKRAGRMAKWLAKEHALGKTEGLLKNIWYGFSAEDQTRLAERSRDFIAAALPPGLRLFISAEPLLGGMDFRGVRWTNGDGSATHYNWLTGDAVIHTHSISGGSVGGGNPVLGGLVVGGESGAKARDCHVEWIREIVTQCRAAEFGGLHVKQLGARPLVFDPLRHADIRLDLADRKGGDMAEWPEDLRIREWLA